MATVEQKVPDLGDFKDVPIIELLVKPGDSVQAEQGLLLLESEKATMEVPASQAGKVVELKVKTGDKVSAGDVIALIETSAPPPQASPTRGEGARPSAPDKSAPSPSTGEGKDGGESKPLTPPPQPAPAQGEDVTPVIIATPGSVHASPAVRLFARELGVDLTRVSGSGPKGRILKSDVQAHVKKVMAGAQLAAPGGAGLPQMPAIDFSKFGPVESKPLSRIRKLSASNLHRSWVLVPHVTQFDEADITELDAFRRESAEDAKKKGIKLTMLAFLLKASAKTLLEFPELCASLAPDGENLVLKKYVHIGVAVDTPNGLVVPVIRDVDKKGIFQLAEELALVSEKARAARLSPPDLQGGCFSISSLGGIGGTKFTPIVNAPEVAILGVSKSQMRPVWDGKGFVPRLILPLSLSYDHRVIDGAQAARVTTYLAELLGDIRRLLL
ncbi:MAG TPA: dihydrolipoyllysine-residue acetyltransferase [Nevskiales bacterium]|nr:dihydrolipoyllysine-residue acetyltransferase [Nevskiales bacterium]